ncbi:MAG TPA: SOS response-associated peptidase [Candidatus Dormibacteraeota bacterium]|nr:SOS response-associated peptidase [Candidatus Dormibacteraeota bacterium]
MCGRFAQQRPAADLAELFGAEPLAAEPGERPNVAPTDEALVVVQRDDRRAIVPFRWGLIPHWADSPRIAARTFNARVETVAATAAFRESFRRRRCIVPVDAFYEWQRDGRRASPFAIRRTDGAPMALAGLWSGWRDPSTGIVRRTFTIVTGPADDRIADLHDRMPLGLRPESWSSWLDPAEADPAVLHAILADADPAAFERSAVDPSVVRVRPRSEELTLRLE